MLFIDRLRKIAVFVYKCKNEIGPSLVHHMYSTKDISYNLRDKSKLVQPKTNTTTFGINSLKYSGAALWNNMLPANLKEIIDFKHFKKLIKTWTGPSCSCGVCTICKLST